MFLPKIWLIILCFLTTNVYSQQDHYRFSLLGGGLQGNTHYKAENYSTAITVKYAHNVGRNLGFAFDLRLNKKSFLGILFQMQDLAWGIKATSAIRSSGIGVMSGSNDGYDIYTAGFKYIRVLVDRKALALEAELSISAIINSKYGYRDLTDTAYTNENLRTFSNNSDVLYQLAAPSVINSDIKLQIAPAVACHYNFLKKFFVIGRVGYQFGFKNIIEEQTIITIKSENKSQLYSFKTKGSGLVFQLGLGYKF